MLRGRILKPKLTGRLLITVFFLLVGFSIDFYFMLFG
jgi:hypothetical protein